MSRKRIHSFTALKFFARFAVVTCHCASLTEGAFHACPGFFWTIGDVLTPSAPEWQHAARRFFNAHAEVNRHLDYQMTFALGDLHNNAYLFRTSARAYTQESFFHLVGAG